MSVSTSVKKEIILVIDDYQRENDHGTVNTLKSICELARRYISYKRPCHNYGPVDEYTAKEMHIIEEEVMRKIFEA